MTIARSLLLVCLVALAPATLAQDLQVGDPAPGFSLPASDGETYSLADFKGRQGIILAWFPMAYTSGCTVECRSLAQKGHLVREYDVSYFMASVDPLEKNTGFAKDSGAHFPLLSDPGKEVAAAYGVLNAGGVANRTTFYIDATGIIVKIDTAVRPQTAAEDMATMLGELGVPKR
jgi:peroxiredoxin Q/BCP